MKKIPLLLTALLPVPATQAALIVNLDPVDARFDSVTDNDDGSGGFPAGAPTAANGLTFNVTFTPAAGDIDSATQAVNVMEIGGDANGSGLYLLGGELHFLSKMNGVGADFVTSFDDLDFASGNNMIGVKSSFGTLTAGTEYTVAVIFDPIETTPVLNLAVLPTGGILTQDSFSPVGVGAKTNWHGDNSASAFRGTNVGNLGGTIISSNGNTTNPFHENNINANPFEGTQGQALYWDQPGAAIVPEPSGSSLLLLGASVALVRRRR